MGTEVERLFAGSPEEFTAGRDALAKRLRDTGDADAAAEVKRLRKPTLAAWLVNQLAHREGKAMKRFVAAAEELEAAQRDALSGAGGERLREAQRGGREAIEGLVASARRIGDGCSPATFDRVRGTLEAALADPEARAAVAAGHLQRELRPGEVPEAPAAVPRRTKPGDRAKEELAAARSEAEQAAEALQEAEEREAEREKDKSEAERRLRDARDALAEAKRTTTDARKRAGAAKRRLDRRRR